MRAGAEEHRNLIWGDVSLHYDPKLNLEYLVLEKERQTKTRTGEDVRVQRKGDKPFMFAEPKKTPDQCPVQVYKLYSDKRSKHACQPESPFYLSCNTIKSRPLSELDQWFISTPVGVNKIGKMMKTMVENADLPSRKNKRLCNTSVRKHVCQTLLEKNVPDTLAIHVTGHTNPGTLNNHCQLSTEQKCAMSHLLANSKSSEKMEVAILDDTVDTVQQTQNVAIQSSVVIKSSDPVQALFAGSTINGGTFNIVIYCPK